MAQLKYQKLLLNIRQHYVAHNNVTYDWQNIPYLTYFTFVVMIMIAAEKKEQLNAIIAPMK